MKRFEEKVALITGGASGIGEATVHRFTAEGAKVVIADYNIEKANRLAEELTRKEADVQPAFFSASDLESCSKLIDFTLSNYGHVDILVNNVGGSNLKQDSNIETLDIHYFDEVFHLNVRCALYLSQRVIPRMKNQGGGNIVNIASISGITGDYQGTLYGISKAGVISLTQYIATQTGKFNIRCNAVAPGLVLTPAALDNLPENVRNIFLQHNSLPYLGEPDNIASVIAFLASEDAKYITGQTIVADGGLTIHNPTVAEMYNLSLHRKT